MAKDKLKSYRVACNHINHGYLYVKAKDEEDAINVAYQKLEDGGNDVIEEIFDREWQSVQAEEI